MFTRWMIYKLLAPLVMSPAGEKERVPLRAGVYVEGWRGPAGETVLVAVGDDGRAVADPRYVRTPAEFADAMQELYDLLPQYSVAARERNDAFARTRTA